jgi:hypothetical protein
MTPRLTTFLIAEVCQRIKAGAFEQVAAESLGIPYATFQGWLRRGRGQRGGRLYRELAKAVPQAQAHARFMAEMQLRREDAKAWLLNGPGRETGAQQGWGSAARGRGRSQAADGEQRQLLLDLCTLALETLAPFPEARTALAETLARWQPPSSDRQPN